MIVQFFNRGKGNGNAPINYLLGKERDREHALLLRGHPEETAAIINSSLYAKKYTSGCLSFEECDITPEQKIAIMDSFEECLFAGLDPDQYNCLWVEHRDKDRLELNFVIPNIELLSGKRLQPYYHPADHKRVDAWRTLQNIKYGLSDPDDPSKRQNLTHAKDLPESAKKVQEAITDGLMSLALAGQLKDRADVLKTLENAGFKISRTTETSISIKNPEVGGRNIRLKGAFYEKDFRFSQDLSRDITARSREHRNTSQSRISVVQSIYQHGIEAKRADNLRRHTRPAATHQPSDIQALFVDTGRIILNRSSIVGSEHLPSQPSPPSMDRKTSSPTSSRKIEQNQQENTTQNVRTQRENPRLRSDSPQFAPMGQEWGIPGHSATFEPTVRKETMNETEIALLNALERLESNRKQTEEQTMHILQQLAERVNLLETENEQLRSTQTALTASLNSLSEQLAQQSSIL